MSEPMFRPRSAIEIIDASFSIYRGNFLTLVAIWGVILAPFHIAGVLIGGLLGSAVSNLSGFLIPVAVGATVAVVSDAMHDRPVSVGRAFAQVNGRWGTLVLVSFTQSLLTGLGFILLIVPGLIVLCWTFAAPMTIVVERMDDTAGAISRSKQLARGQFGHILGTLILSWLTFFLLMVAAGFGVGFLGEMIGASETIRGLLIAWVLILTVPIFGAASGLLYFDLRVRNDAYDVERLAQTLGENAATPVSG